MKNQVQMFYDASRKIGERDSTFLELVNHPTNPLTREDLQANIKRRPALWGRYAGFLKTLPVKDSGNE